MASGLASLGALVSLRPVTLVLTLSVTLAIPRGLMVTGSVEMVRFGDGVSRMARLGDGVSRMVRLGDGVSRMARLGDGHAASGLGSHGTPSSGRY